MNSSDSGRLRFEALPLREKCHRSRHLLEHDTAPVQGRGRAGHACRGRLRSAHKRPRALRTVSSSSPPCRRLAVNGRPAAFLVRQLGSRDFIMPRMKRCEALGTVPRAKIISTAERAARARLPSASIRFGRSKPRNGQHRHDPVRTNRWSCRACRLPCRGASPR